MYSHDLHIDSHILQQRGKQAQDTAFLRRLLNNPKSIKLLHRASQNNFSAKAFHNKCDHIENTLILVKTQFGRTIGGFTHYKWNQDHSGTYVHDEGRKAFMFQLDLQQHLPACGKEYLIRNQREMGPIFGYGYDLALFDNYYNKNFCGSYARIGQGYNVRDPELKYDYKNQQSIQKFSGAPKGVNFKVVEYQVLYVIYQ